MILDNDIIIKGRIDEEVNFQNLLYESVKKVVVETFNLFSTTKHDSLIGKYVYYISDGVWKTQKQIYLYIKRDEELSKSIDGHYKEIRDKLHMIRKTLKSNEKIVFK